ncbi:MAG: selenide, water dikinase SelD, partial [Firmicutes bacterium]|nr:selenide, water dikinase SelD [Bacillota bacterium]
MPENDKIRLTKLAAHGGCAAKVAPGDLKQVLAQLPTMTDPNLMVGFDTSDDAAVYRISDDLALIQTVDIFPPVVDDPFDYGRIAAANALSDVYAMGGEPKLALNVLCIPEDLDKEITLDILRGGQDRCREAGAVICGGHSIKDKEPKYGLCVSGFVNPSRFLPNSNAKPGDVLILTKALGTGILNTAMKADLIAPSSAKAAIESMATLNKTAAEIVRRFNVNACTDVTGFGLVGHSYEMATGSKVTITLESKLLPLLPEAYDMAQMGIVPAGAYGNRNWIDCGADVIGDVDLALTDIMF